MLKYWSEAVILKNTQVPAVVAIKLPVLSAYLMIGSATLLSSPVASIAPPNTIAQIISQIVLSIPAIPLVESKLFIISFSVVMEISDPIALITVVYAALKLSVSVFAICFINSG